MSKHKLRTVLQHGDPDVGAEIEVEIVFTFSPGSAAIIWGDNMHPEEPAAVDFVSAKPEWVNTLAQYWFETDDGQTAAFEVAADDDERGREYAAELRADR